MKTKNLFIAISFTFLALLPASALFAENAADKKSETEASTQAPAAPKDNSSPELKRIKGLEGRWRSTTSMFGKQNEEVFTEYKVTAGGSAVLETIFPGTPQEMVSVYFDDDKGKLAMTHYCIMHNRPQFKLAKSGKDEIRLGLTKVEGQKSKNEPSMGSTTIKFIDNDHFSSTCESNAKSEHNKDPMVMEFTRVG